MELWIRSQDKKRLTKCYDLRIYKAPNEELWVIEDCDDLGAYKTEERALAVLDEIQRELICVKKGIITAQDKKGIEFTPFTNTIIVYEMPKE